MMTVILMSKQSIKIEDIQAWQEQKKFWNSLSLEDVEFTRNGEPYKPQLFWVDVEGNATDPIGVDDFKFMGVSTHTVFEMIVDDLE